MSDSPSTPPFHPDSYEWWPLQFSLRTILIVTALVAVSLFVLTGLPWLILILAFILVLGILPTTLVILAIYARGTVRTFAIGALVPLVLGMLSAEGLGLSSLVLAPLVAACCGGVALWLRRQIRRRGWDRTDSDANAR